MQKLIKVRKIIFLFFLIMPKSFVIAGSLDSPEDVGHQQSTMYTLSDIYNRLHSGTEGALSDGGFVEPASGPASSGYDLNDIMQIAPQTDDSNGAEIINVLETTTFWGVKSSNWGLQSGTMKNIGQQQVTPTISEQIISQGYHDGTGVVAGDADLLTANIKAGITIFDIEGKKEVVDTSSGDAVAAEIIKDKKAWVDGVEVIGTQSVQTLNNINEILSAGSYEATTLSTVDTDLSSDNIKKGINIFGITGNDNVVDTGSGDAVAEDIIKDKKAWVDGVEVIGTQSLQTLNNISDILAAGSYEATTLSTVDTDLSSDNIKKGINIFGITGNDNVVDTSSGDAIAENIESGKKAWVDGIEIIGTIAAGNNVSGTDGQLIIDIPDGLYSATKTATASDTNLIQANICTGKTIFGVAGSASCN